MARRKLPFTGLVVLLAMGILVLPTMHSASTRKAPIRTGAATGTTSGYGHLPLRFEANAGQFGDDVRFVSRGSGPSLRFGASSPTVVTGAGSITIQPVGANAAPAVEGVDRLGTVSNYFVGDPSRWRTGVANYAQVAYRGVYPGVDAVYHAGEGGGLEYDFVVAPGADPSRIAIRFDGAHGVALDGEEIVVNTPSGAPLRQHRPTLYQDVGGTRRPVAGHATVDDTGVVRFTVGAYDHRLPLVIDPVIQYSTYLGGAMTDEGDGIAVDNSGAAYVAGTTSSADFPTASPAQARGGNPACSSAPDVEGICPDVFVAKLDPSGGSLVYSTYLGGALDDKAHGIAIDTLGDAFITGQTRSPNFPVTADAYQSRLVQGPDNTSLQCLGFLGCTDAFVAKLAPSGALAYSTFLGGSLLEQGNGIAVDGGGHVHVVGSTSSGNGAAQPFPTTTSFGPTGANSMFYVELTPGRPTLDFSVLIDGAGTSYGFGVAVDNAGLAYVVGEGDGGFPVKNAFQPVNGGDFDATVSIVDPTRTGTDALVGSTFLGGFLQDVAAGVAVDNHGGVYVTGSTRSFDFPVVHPVQASFGGWSDVFISKLTGGVSQLSYSSFLGRTDQEAGRSVAVDSYGDAYFFGVAVSYDLYQVNPIQPGFGGGSSDALVGRINATGTSLDFLSFLGGAQADQGTAVAVNSTGTYLTGFTTSTNFPTSNALFATSRGGQDAFVTKLSPDPPPPAATHAVADFDGNGASDASVFRPAAGTWFSDSGTALGWGAAGDAAVPGDYDGDGKTDEAIFRPSTGLWAIHGSTGADTFVTYGVGSDIPAPADYDGDGKTDIAVYRPSTGTWFIHRSSDGTDTAVTFGGIAGDVAVPADYDGDGHADIAIFRSGTWYVHPSSGGADTAVTWGASADIPVAADYDGDAKADIAIYRPSTGLWAVHPSGGADTFLTYGVSGDVPVPADYDGDGKTDIAVFRPSTGAWFEHRGGLSPTATDTVVTFGISGDVALPLPEAVRRNYF